MRKYTVVERVVTYCSVEIEAPNAEEAAAMATDDHGDLDWSYDTDYDDSLSIEAFGHDNPAGLTDEELDVESRYASKTPFHDLDGTLWQRNVINEIKCRAGTPYEGRDEEDI